MRRITEGGQDGMVGAWMSRCHTTYHLLLVGVDGGQGKLPMNTVSPEE